MVMDQFQTKRKLDSEKEHWNKLFEKCKEARVTFEREWYLNMAFYFGKQYVSYTPATARSLTGQRLTEPPAPRYRVRLVANKVMPGVRNEYVKLTKEEPQYYVSPESSEPKDVSAARVGEGLFEYCLTEYGFNAARRRATWWALICGTSFIRTSMNDDQLRTMDYLPVTAFHLFAPNLLEEEIQKQPFLIHARAVDPNMVKKRWNLNKVNPTVEDDKGASIENVLMNTMGVKTPSEKQCYLKEIWIRPGVNPKYPDGTLIVMVDDEIMEMDVYDNTQSMALNSQPADGDSAVEPNVHLGGDEEFAPGPYPYKHGRYPFQKIDHIPTGRFYADSSVKYIIPLQKEYNRTRSQVIESKNRMGKPQMSYTKGSIDPNKVTSEPGLMIAVQPGMDHPQVIQQPEIPGYVIQEQDRILQDMNDIIQYEGAKNSTPPGVEAASAIAYLQEENDSKLYPAVASIEDAVAECGKQTLKLIQQFWPVDQVIEVVSKNNSMEAMQFMQAEQSGMLGTDLRVESGSMAPRSQAAKQAFITELMKLGLLPPEKGLRYLQLNETNKLYDELQAGNRKAQRENFLMSQAAPPQMPVPQPGMDPMMDPSMDPMAQPEIDPMTGQPVMPGLPDFPINDWDNDTVHAYEHALYLNSQEFEMLDPMVQQVHLNHYRAHMERIAASQMQTQGANNAGGIQPGVSEPGQPTAA